MLTIDTAAALDQPLDPDIRRLIVLRFQQMGGPDDTVRFHIVEPGDDIAAVELILAVPLLLIDGADEAPSWEWAEWHGSVIEVAFIFGDAADVLLIPANDSIDADLMGLLHLQAADDLELQQTTARSSRP